MLGDIIDAILYVAGQHWYGQEDGGQEYSENHAGDDEWGQWEFHGRYN